MYTRTLNLFPYWVVLRYTVGTHARTWSHPGTQTYTVCMYAHYTYILYTVHTQITIYIYLNIQIYTFKYIYILVNICYSCLHTHYAYIQAYIRIYTLPPYTYIHTYTYIRYLTHVRIHKIVQHYVTCHIGIVTLDLDSIRNTENVIMSWIILERFDHSREVEGYWFLHLKLPNLTLPKNWSL